MLRVRRKNMGWSLLIPLIIVMTAVTLFTSIGIFRDPRHFSLAIISSLYYPLLVIHISLGTIAVFSGMVQFFPQIRRKRPQVHRLIGRIYMGSVLISGMTALFVALFTVVFNEQVAFLTLDVLWLLSGWKAFRAIRQGKVELHRLWVVRTYALTLAAIFARLVVPLLILLLLLRGSLPAGGFTALLTEGLGTGVWLSIVLNLVFADWLVNRHQKVSSTAASIGVAQEK